MTQPIEKAAEVTYLSVRNTGKLLFVYNNLKKFTARNVEPESVHKFPNKHGTPMIGYQQRFTLPTEQFDAKFRIGPDGVGFNEFWVATGIVGYLVTYSTDSETGQTEFDVWFEVDTIKSDLNYVIYADAGLQHAATVISAQTPLSLDVLFDGLKFA